MFAVIFRAEFNEPDESYYETSLRLRELAFSKYGCVEFAAVTEGNQEIVISYWNSEEQIIAWKQDPEHQLAQKNGRTKWYKSYKIQVVKIEREYGPGTMPL